VNGVDPTPLEELEEEVAARRRDATFDPGRFEPALAQSLTRLADELVRAERHDAALAAAGEAFTIAMRRLADTRATPEDKTLTEALNALVSRLGRYRGPQTVAAIQENFATYRRLADAEPEAFAARFAQELEDRIEDLGAAGAPHLAVAAMEEAVAIWRRLAAADPDTYERRLAKALNALSLQLREAGRVDEEAAVLEEAVAMWRRLVR
jgi:hypothetical protein